jgi:NAD(P)-dependent dehydrogenase (short-subunit alcohol dehydrogenase family)
MSHATKTVVVIGASGVVGSGVVRRYLDGGARVLGVSRSEDRLAALRETMHIDPASAFRGVVADFGDEAAALAAKDAIARASDGGAVDHVVSVQGFAPVGPGPTSTPLADFGRALDDGLYNNFLAAKVLLPGMKPRAGSSFTLVSGGLAHVPPPVPGLWLGTVKNAALNALVLALASETARDAVRVNGVCIHFSVAPPGGTRNSTCPRRVTRSASRPPSSRSVVARRRGKPSAWRRGPRPTRSARRPRIGSSFS